MSRSHIVLFRFAKGIWIRVPVALVICLLLATSCVLALVQSYPLNEDKNQWREFWYIFEVAESSNPAPEVLIAVGPSTVVSLYLLVALIPCQGKSIADFASASVHDPTC